MVQAKRTTVKQEVHRPVNVQSRPGCSGSCSEQLPDALFRIKKAPLQVCELDMTLITLLMRFPGHLIVDGATFYPATVLRKYFESTRTSRVPGYP